MKIKYNTLRSVLIILTLALSVFTVMQPITTYAATTMSPAEACENNTVGGNTTEGDTTNNPCVEPPLIPKPGTLPGPSPITDTGVNHERYLITDLIPTLVRGAINLLAGITIIAIMYGGIQYLTAFGDDTKLENAKKNIIYALIGLLIAMFSYTIVRIISEVPLTDSNEIPQAESQDPQYTP